MNEHQAPGQQNEPAYCLGHCPNPCVSPPLLAKMWDLEQRNHHKGSYLSASSIAGDGCARQTWYERQPNVDFYEQPKRRFWPTRGTVIHGLIEGVQHVVAPFGWMQELRMAVPLQFPEYPAPVFDQGKWTGDYDSTQHLTVYLGGTTDAYNPYRRWLHDFKSCDEYKVRAFLRGAWANEYHAYVKETWFWQLQIYAWMVAQTHIDREHAAAFAAHGLPALPGPTFPYPERLQLQVISMMEIPLTATDRAYQYKPDPKKRDLEDAYVTDVPVLPPNEVEAFIRPRALQWYRWLVLNEEPPVVDKSKWWMCKGCPFSRKFAGGPCAGA